jgi:hypothetical protein
MRYIDFLFFFLISLREISQQSLWESEKVPLLFAGPLHFPIGLDFTGFYPQISLKSQNFVHSCIDKNPHQTSRLNRNSPSLPKSLPYKRDRPAVLLGIAANSNLNQIQTEPLS